MSENIQIVSHSSSRDYTAEGMVRSVTGTSDGALYTCEYVLNKAIEGKLFHANVGDLTTPVVFRIAADADQPEGVIDVPTGTTIIPVNINVHLEDSAGTDTEIIALANPALAGAGTSTAGTIRSARLGSNKTSACKFYYTYSGNCTAPSGYIQFWHAGLAFVGDATVGLQSFAWNWRDFAPVVIVGPGSLVLHIDGTTTAPGGYWSVAYMEFDSTTF